MYGTEASSSVKRPCISVLQALSSSVGGGGRGWLLHSSLPFSLWHRGLLECPFLLGDWGPACEPAEVSSSLPGRRHCSTDRCLVLPACSGRNKNCRNMVKKSNFKDVCLTCTETTDILIR